MTACGLCGSWCRRLWCRQYWSWRWRGTRPKQAGSILCFAMQGFIHVVDGRFVDDSCREFLFHGWNGWKLLANAMSNPSSITEQFQQAQEAGLNLMRFFIADDESGPTFLRGPTDFDEKAAQALDFIVAEAGRLGIRLTPVLLNTWKAPNGIPSFEKWCGTAGSSTRPRPDIDPRGSGPLSPLERLQTPYDWLMSPKCRQQVKDYFSVIINRRNSITGVLYRDDPTIFSWDLLNEPRCKYCGPEAVDSWYAEMSAHLKSIDPNHMVTTGAEGFFVEGDAYEDLDPGTDYLMWGPRSGQDFRANHAHPGIDYAVIHMWVDNWLVGDSQDWGRRWIESHMQAASELGKPLVMEEFGKASPESQISSVRDPWFDMVQSEVEQSLQAGDALRGALFWQWDGPWGETEPRGPDSNLVRRRDSTFTAHITPFAKGLADQSGQPVAGCTPRVGPAGGSAGAPAVTTFDASKPASSD
ncbi:hypothetical protein ABPG77_001746 [Micractinium sp. CCAP 211/92]